MSARVESGDLPKMASAAGKSGKALPSWAADNPALRKAYYDGAGKPDPDASPVVKHAQDNPTRKPKASATGPATKPARSRSKRKGTVFTAENARGLVTRPARTLGTPGGLMLAIFAYPILLAVLEDGPAGVNKWLAAKFLNKGTQTLAQHTPEIQTNNPNKNQPAAPGGAVGRLKEI